MASSICVGGHRSKIPRRSRLKKSQDYLKPSGLIGAGEKFASKAGLGELISPEAAAQKSSNILGMLIWKYTFLYR